MPCAVFTCVHVRAHARACMCVRIYVCVHACLRVDECLSKDIKCPLKVIVKKHSFAVVASCGNTDIHVR